MERLHRIHRALECYGNSCPEVLLTEFSKSFEKVSVEEATFDPSRAAVLAEVLFSLIDRKIDWTFYYHLWDQHCVVPEFTPFFKEPYIMQSHWNEIPHRFGLFGVKSEVRPSYFVYRMLATVGNTEVIAEKHYDDLCAKAFTGTNNEVSAMVVNQGAKGAGDVIVVVKFTGLTPGIRTLKNYRIDGNRCWNEDNLDFYPVEQRDIYVNEDFEFHIYCPKDSVSLLCIE
jgi:xylan 1,4-beta-xylosidase